MVVAEQGDLASLIEFWLSVKEIERLIERLSRASDAELEGLSHYVTEPGTASSQDASGRGGESLPRFVRADHRRRQEQILL
jgi:hypothetical protein